MSAGAIKQPRHVLGTAEAAKGYSLVRIYTQFTHQTAIPVTVQASHWETAAALTSTQTRALDNLADKLAQQPQVGGHQPCMQPATPTYPPTHKQPSIAAATTVTAPAPSGAPLPPGEEGEDEVLEDAMLHNTNQFYKWISELEAARTSESERKYEAYSAILRGHLEASSLVEDRVRGGV